MILKVRNGMRNNDWRLIDNIAEVNYSIVDAKEEISSCKVSTRGFLFTDSPHLIEAYISFRDHTGEIIYTDNTMYILDDSGKTIETIYNCYSTAKIEDYYKKKLNEPPIEEKCEEI